ncbi:MAG: restriction endonuclease subunit S [Gemmatimonadales bacterium]
MQRGAHPRAMVPEGWAATTLGAIADVGTGATPNRADLSYWQGGEVPWVTSGMLNQDFVRDPSECVTQKALNETNLTLYPPGTLLLAMYGEGKTRGKCSELLIEAATNQAIAAIQFIGSGESLRPYVKIALRAQYEVTRRLASGGVQPNLNLSLVRAIQLAIPPAVEQARIVAEVERHMSILAALEQSIAEARSRAAQGKQSILKQAFSGKLVLQDANDEPATMLLERIHLAHARQGNNGRPRRRTNRGFDPAATAPPATAAEHPTSVPRTRRSPGGRRGRGRNR